MQRMPPASVKPRCDPSRGTCADRLDLERECRHRGLDAGPSSYSGRRSPSGSPDAPVDGRRPRRSGRRRARAKPDRQRAPGTRPRRPVRDRGRGTARAPRTTVGRPTPASRGPGRCTGGYAGFGAGRPWFATGGCFTSPNSEATGRGSRRSHEHASRLTGRPIPCPVTRHSSPGTPVLDGFFGRPRSTAHRSAGRRSLMGTSSAR